jgi:hypothetical protein
VLVVVWLRIPLYAFDTFRFDNKDGTCYSEFMTSRQDKAPHGPYTAADGQTAYRYTWSDNHSPLKYVPVACCLSSPCIVLPLSSSFNMAPALRVWMEQGLVWLGP